LTKNLQDESLQRRQFDKSADAKIVTAVRMRGRLAHPACDNIAVVIRCSVGGAQVFRRSAHLSGRVQSRLLRVARAEDLADGREPGAGSQPPLPAL